VSSELENSVADTFVGTGTYMAPERIQGSPYTVKSDVWSVGLTLMELAIGKFPFSIESDDPEEAAGPQGILDLLQQIVLEPSPKLPKSDAFPKILEDVIDKCLMKNPAQRPTPQELFDTDPFLQAAKRTPVDLEAWAVSMMEKHNRKSHFEPQLSPETRVLRKHEDATPRTATARGPSYQSYSTQPTPTSAISLATPTTSSNGLPTPLSGGGIGGTMSSNGARPGYPTRTSSAQTVPSASPAYGQQPMQLPIRQAPGSRSGRPDTAGSDRSDGSYARRAPRPGYVQGA
jgi:mitogen-activated protein kinase kinase